jgi:hypothetical protein
MSRNSIIVVSTAILLATTATGAFARGGGGGGGEHFAGSSTFTSEFASHAVRHQAVREVHRLTSVVSHPIRIGVVQKKPTAKDDPDPTESYGDDCDCGDANTPLANGTWDDGDGKVGFSGSDGDISTDGDFPAQTDDGTAAAVKGPSNPPPTTNIPSSNLTHPRGDARSTIAQ